MQKIRGTRPDHPRPRAVFAAPGLQVERTADWGTTTAAIFDRQAGEGVWFNHRHRLVLPLSDLGTVTHRIDLGRSVHAPVWSGAMAFYPAQTTVHITHGPGRFAHVLLDPALFRDVGLALEGRPELSVEPMTPFEDPLTAEIVRTLAGGIGAGSASRLLADSLVNALTVRILSRSVSPLTPLASGRGLSRERLGRVLDYIEANLEHELTLVQVAEVACLTPTHFSRTFKLAAGAGLSRFVTQRRVARAKTLLGQPRISLAAIAQAAGFNDQSYFTSVFRRETGMTPGQFRARSD